MSADQIVSNLLATALALATGAALWRHVLPREVLAAATDWWRGMGRASRVFLAALLATGVLYGGGKMRLLLPPLPQFPLPQPAFTESERAAGFACVAGEAAPWMPTNAAVLADFASVTNAAAHRPWLATGVCDDYFTLTPPTNAPIRLGTNGVRRLVVFSQGAVRAILDDGSHALLEPYRATLAFLPEGAWAALGVTSRCWTASSPASTVVAWENALLARDPSRPLSFQVEFLPDGDFLYRYGDREALTNAVSAAFSRGGATVTGAVARASALLFRCVEGLGDGTGDADGDGLSDWLEVQLGTNPRVADTDGDGLPDGAEVDGGSNPRDFDTDGDGLADAVDPEPLVSCGNAYGQSAAWVSATFPDASAILAGDYSNYVQSAAVGDQFHYVFTVSVSELGAEGRALLRVGDHEVVANAPGAYPFVLANGPEYVFGLSPGCTASVSASCGAARIEQTQDPVSGTVAVPAQGVSATPSGAHYFEPGESHAFSGECVGALPSVVDSWSWSCDADDVAIESPSSQSTAIEWNWTNDAEVVEWETRSVTLTCRIGEWAATNCVTMHRGTHLAPETLFFVQVPHAFFATNGADVVVYYKADEPAETTISVETLRGAALLDDGPPWSWDISGDCRLFCATNRIRASRPSDEPGDIEIYGILEYSDGDGGLWTGGGTTTAVTLEEVLLPTAPGGRLAVRAGTSVAMLAACAPAGANPDTAECDWFLGRRKRDGSYDDWEKIAWEVSGSAFSCPMTNGGVYRVKVEMTLAGETQETFYKIKSRTDLDPPIPHYDVGGYDHIGVASEQWQLDLRNEALPHLGSTEYAEAAFVGVRHGFAYFSRGTDKCNIFVAHVAEDAGLNIPGIHGHNPLLPYPPLANDWATGAVPIRGWQHLSANHPEPGWIVGHFAIGNGHCGIVDYDGYAIGAGRDNVNRAFWQFLDGSSEYNGRDN